MQRDLPHLARSEFDLVVVGGGIYGAWTAFDAAQRGLSVALIEQNDFCSATSANNHRIIHGGLRYLQHGDIRRMRESIRERSILLRIAPDLVRPMPVAVPTTRNWSQHRLVMRSALLFNEAISARRNAGLPRERQIPASRLLSLEELSAMSPGILHEGATGGALFYDAQVLSPERLALTVLQHAHSEGAVVANHVRATGYIRQGDRTAGVQAMCALSGERFEIRGRTVANCVGPWSAEQICLSGEGKPEDLDTFKAAVLVTRDLGLKAAVAVAGRTQYSDPSEVLRKNYRNYFITPWRGLSLIGTFYALHEGAASTCSTTEQDVEGWLKEINGACPSLDLGRKDVHRVLAGLLPRAPGSHDAEQQYAKRFRIIDHGAHGGMRGLLTVVGVKFTTARGVAERVVDTVAKHLNRELSPCRTDRTFLKSSAFVPVDARLAAAELREHPCLLRSTIQRAVQREMACTLSDVVLRRTDLASAGDPTEQSLAACADIMGDLLGWSAASREREFDDVRTACGLRRSVNAA